MSTSKGVWITKEMIQDKNLSWTKKIILQEIQQLTELEHGCIASNRHFAELLGISKPAVSMALKELESDGYITIDNSETYRNFGRKITIKQTEQGLSQLNTPIKQTEQSPIKQTEQSKDNKTNSTNSNIKEKTNKKEFSFSLSKKQSYDNLSEEYKQKLRGKCLLTDGNIERYEEFVTQLQAKGYQYKDFSKAYMAWDKEKKYKSFTPEPEPKLGESWRRIRTGGRVFAVNVDTLKIKEGTIKVKSEETIRQANTNRQVRPVDKLLGSIADNTRI